jgi:tellurite resistance protein TerC
VLRFGIAGALVFRALMIGAGIALIARFAWVTYPFAVLILLAAWRMLFGAERERDVVQAACNVCETWIARVVRVSPVLHGGDFWRREGGRLVATPLLVALVVIETTDIVFALDSVPAVLSVTRNSFIVYSSNVMAMLGLRSLYFVMGDALDRLRYLRPGLALILVFTGSKMLVANWIHVSAGVSVLVIAIVLLATIAASALLGNKMARHTRAGSDTLSGPSGRGSAW